MITRTVRFFEDKENGDEEFVTVCAENEISLQNQIDLLWSPSRELIYDGVE